MVLAMLKGLRVLIAAFEDFCCLVEGDLHLARTTLDGEEEHHHLRAPSPGGSDLEAVLARAPNKLRTGLSIGIMLLPAFTVQSFRPPTSDCSSYRRVCM